MTFEVYGKDACQYCFRAAALLTLKKLPFREFKLGKDFTREELLEMFPNAQTFPQIKLDTGEIIGGYSDLVKHLGE